MDSLKLFREMYEEDTDEQIKPSKRFKFSESTDLGHQRSTGSSSPTMEPSQPFQEDAIQSMREMYQKIDPLVQIDPLLTFVDTKLQKMNNPSEAGSSSSDRWLETVREGTKLAAKTIDTISTEAEKLSVSEDAVEVMRKLALKVVKEIEELHLVFISTAAFALRSYTRVSSTKSECRELLFNILELAKNVKQYREGMHDTEKLCNAVGIIVEGGVICWDYLTRGETFRFWSTTTAAAQLEKTNQQLKDIRDSIQLIKDYRGHKEVFLSHSGKQKNFVRQLHRDLTIEHVSCFFDVESLPLAQKFPPLIFKHAETCKIAVLVLSKEFICSKWPMQELSAFIRAKNSGKNVNLRLLPIFFMINPKELHITKDSPEWQKLEVSNDRRGEWEAALKEVRSTKGLEFGENGNEVDLREKVVEEIRCILEQIDLESPSQLLDFEPVGIEWAQKKVIDLLDLRDLSRRVVVIYGVGGIGKTTVANAVFKSLDLTGYHSCRVDMDQYCKLSDLQAIQEQILHDLFKENLKLSNCTHGREKLSKAFGKASKPVFLFIDNALRKTDLEKLLPVNHISGLPMRSRILVTTRNLKETKICRLQQGIQFHSHRIDSVSEPEAKRILFHYAVGDKNVNFDRGVYMDGLLRICGGIPLVLRIVGSHLGTEILDREGNVESACNDTLQYFKEWQQEGFEGGEEDVSESMVGFVYGRLKEPCKQAFLDIAFFFHGWERSKVADIVGEVELKDLELAALVTTAEKESWETKKTVVVKMHDIVRARGNKLSEGTRITDIESLSILLSDAQKLQQIKGIWLCNANEELSLEKVDLMSTSLRVLCLEEGMRLNGRWDKDMLAVDLSKASRLIFFQGHLIKGDTMSEAKFTLNLPECLRLLYLDAPWNSLVSLDINGHLTSLRDLRISKITFENFETNIRNGNFSCLKILNIDDYNLKGLPDSFGNLSCLQTLHMRYSCKLQGLPESFGNLSYLQTLDMRDCSTLQGLPESFGNLSCLQTLHMTYSCKLQGLPESFGNLSCLQTLDMRDCSTLHGLPESFGNLSSLQTLYTRHCSTLQGLPESFGNLSCLQTLDMIGCSTLQGLPESFGNLSCLQTLNISSCSMLQGLPESFGNLSCLRTLDMIGCSTLQGLPESFGNVSCLQTLNISSCSRLKGLPESFGNLSSLQTLYMSDCSKLQGLSDSFGNLSCLKTLDMRDCYTLEGLPESFGNLSCMQTLDMRKCYMLQGLPESFGNLSSLQTLNMRKCSKLQGLPESFGNLSCLQTLNMRSCSTLQGLPESFGNLSCLQTLDMKDCSTPQGLPESFGNLSGLQTLDMRDCSMLQELPESFGNLSCLQTLNMRSCSTLQGLPESFGKLSCLKTLDMRDCSTLQGLPESFLNLSGLQRLGMMYWSRR